MGISPDTPRFDHAIDLEAGPTLLLYTDGLVERRDVDFDDEIDNLATTLSNVGDLDPDPLCDAIIDSTAALEVGDDDIALLVLRCTAEPIDARTTSQLRTATSFSRSSEHGSSGSRTAAHPPARSGSEG
jgi:serine/threonine protein phosphatase PrpC